MTSASHPPSTPLAQPLDAVSIDILRIVDTVARSLGYDYVLVGATARDIVFINIFGLTGWRATRDIDFGIAVQNWEAFYTFKRALIDTEAFQEAARENHRVYYRLPPETKIPADIIPFGGVAEGDGTIAWPPSRDFVMNVAGFQEALESAILARIEDKLHVRVASIPGLTVLKLLAWRDRRHVTNKDALDLIRILARYADAGNLDRLYGHDIDLLEEAGFAVDLAGAALLGRDSALTCASTTRAQVCILLQAENTVAHFIHQITQGVDDSGDELNHSLELLDRFRAGFLSACA